MVKVSSVWRTDKPVESLHSHLGLEVDLGAGFDCTQACLVLILGEKYGHTVRQSSQRIRDFRYLDCLAGWHLRNVQHRSKTFPPQSLLLALQVF